MNSDEELIRNTILDAIKGIEEKNAELNPQEMKTKKQNSFAFMREIMQAGFDSTGQVVVIGSKVSWRGKEYTIKKFIEGKKGACQTNQIEFEEEQHVPEIPDEISIDLITL